MGECGKRIKILVLAYYVPPMGGVGVQRVLSLIKYLPRYGFDLVVLTSTPGVHKVMDESLLQVEQSPHCKVVRIGGELLRRRLEFAGKGRLHRIARLTLLKYLKYMDIYGAWSSRITDAAVELATRENVDLVYSTSPPHSTHLLARKIKSRLQLPWVMELRDSMTVWPLRRPGLLTRILSRIEFHYEPGLYRDADGVVFVTPSQQSHARQRVPSLQLEKTAVITNGFDEERALSTASTSLKNRFRLTYTGSLSDFDLSTFCKALGIFAQSEAMREVGVEFIVVGAVDPVSLGLLESLRGKVDLRVIGVVPYAEALAYQSSADCLLLVQTANHGNAGDEILTGKVFEYIAARKPILAAAIPGDLTRLIEDNQFGAVANPFQVDQIVAALEACYSCAHDADWLRQRAEKSLVAYTRGEKARETAAFIHHVLEGHPVG